jgi:hypothetical protein
MTYSVGSTVFYEPDTWSIPGGSKRWMLCAYVRHLHIATAIHFTTIHYTFEMKMLGMTQQIWSRSMDQKNEINNFLTQTGRRSQKLRIWWASACLRKKFIYLIFLNRSCGTKFVGSCEAFLLLISGFLESIILKNTEYGISYCDLVSYQIN